MNILKIGKKIFIPSIESLAKVKNYNCYKCKGKLKHAHRNLFYCEHDKLYQFRPQPKPFFWKIMHKWTLLTAYQNSENMEGRKKSAEKTLKLIEKYSKKGKLFDVGANGGIFLSVARDRGWKIDGNEISSRAIEWAKTNLKIKLRNGYFEDFKLKKNSYESVVMWNVIEHTHDPWFVLKKTHAILKKKGIVAMMIPTKTKKEIRSYYEPFHLFEFTREGMRTMLEEAGFKKLYEKEFKESCNVTTYIYQKK